jgi:putative transposase
MPHPPKETPGPAWFHVMNRAKPPGRLLEREGDAANFLALVGRMARAAGLTVGAYCLLEQHYHLLVGAVRSTLDEALLRFEEDWGERLQASREHAGKLLPAGTSRLLPVGMGRHLAEVSRYIHLNPFEAGLSWTPEDWPHSSYRGYLGDPGAPAWLRTDVVLAHFGSIGARHRYRSYVEAGMDPGTRDADGRPRWKALFREGSLAEDLAWRVEPHLPPGPRLAAPAPVDTPTSLPLLARAIAEAFGTSAEALRTERRGGRPTSALARGVLVHAARRADCCRLRDVAAWLGYASPRAAALAAARAERAFAADPALASRIERALGSRPGG